VVAQATPDLRSADELHDLLLTLVLLPVGEATRWEAWLEELRAAGRAVLRDGFWRPAERSGAELLDAVRGWVGITGPITAPELARKLGVASVDAELAALENDGLVLRGRYRQGAGETEWCERTLLSRIHALTLGRLRRGDRAGHHAGLLPLPVSAGSTCTLERSFMARRGCRRSSGSCRGSSARRPPGRATCCGAPGPLRRTLLDELCFSGEIAWGRLACADESPRRAPPGRATPIALVRREDLPRLLARPAARANRWVTGRGCLLALLEQRGALFPHELRAQTGLSGRDLNGALWELVSGGRLTCDGFAALRGLLEGKAHSASGRWSLLRPYEPEQREPELAGEAGAAVPPPITDRLPRSAGARTAESALERAAPNLSPAGGAGEIRGGRFAQAFSGEQFAPARGGGRNARRAEDSEGGRGARFAERVRSL